MTNQWTSSTSGIKNKASPIPISFAIPESYTATGPNAGDPILIDPYTVRFRINPPFIIPDNCSCGLTQASFAFSQPNIVGAAVLESAPTGNDRLTADFGSGAVDIVLDEGLYSYLDVQSALNIWVRTHDATGAVSPPATALVTGGADLFILTGISSTQKIVFSLNPMALAGAAFPAGGITISFTNPGVDTGLNDSIGPVLGFPIIGAGSTFTTTSLGTDIESFYAPNTAGFSNTSAYSLYMSLVTASYQNGSTGQLLYSFPLGGHDPNTIIGYQPTLRYPVQISSGTFSAVDIWTADQNGRRLPWSRYQAPFQFSAIISKNREDGSI